MLEETVITMGGSPCKKNRYESGLLANHAKDSKFMIYK
jgi:hypothetical protein